MAAPAATNRLQKQHFFPQLAGSMIIRQKVCGVFANVVNSDRSRRNTSALGMICLAVLSIVVSLGLWPFHAPRHDAAWLEDSNGLSLVRSGTVISSDTLNLTDSKDETCC